MGACNVCIRSCELTAQFSRWWVPIRQRLRVLTSFRFAALMIFLTFNATSAVDPQRAFDSFEGIALQRLQSLTWASRAAAFGSVQSYADARPTSSVLPSEAAVSIAAMTRCSATASSKLGAVRVPWRRSAAMRA